MGSLKDYQVNAAGGDITIYFDTSCTGKDGEGSNWKKDPGTDKIYYYTFKSVNNPGIQEMELVPGKPGYDGGKLYKATINKENYSYLVILSENSMEHKINRTIDFQTSNLEDNSILMLTTDGLETEGGGFVQTMYVRGDYVAPAKYQGETFSILNMDDNDADVWIQYSTRVKKENGEWGPTEGTVTSTAEKHTLTGRHYYLNQFVVPPANSGSDPWQTVTIYADSGLTEEIKKYYFPEGKILGRSFFYGVTDFQSADSPLDYGDQTKLCYQTSNLEKVGGVNYELYFDKGSFPKSATNIPKYGSSKTSATAIAKDGNAKFKTNGNVSITEKTDISGTDVDLSENIYSIEYKGVQYNLFAPKNEGDNLITINDNVAAISGTYTVQSTNNVLEEGSNKYNYITTQADFYDYQYDHNSTIDNSYTYSYSEPRYLIFTKTTALHNTGKWNTVNAYFYSGGTNNVWPGVQMDYIGTNDMNEHQYKIVIPPWASIAIVNNGSSGGSNQTVDFSVAGTGSVGYYSNFTEGSKEKVPVCSFTVTNTFNEGSTSLRGKAKRPYLTINEAVSGSDYASDSSNYPMYLGQFWLPKMDSGYYNTSEHMYTSSTVGQRAGHNGNDDKYYYSDITDEYQYNYGFGKQLTNFNWSSNLAFRYADQAPGTYEPYDAVVQGLVNKTLRTESDGKYTLMANDNKNTIPYFDSSWWNKSYTSSDGKSGNLKTDEYIKEYDNLSFPFFETAASDIKKFQKSSLAKGKLVSNQSRNYEGTYYVFDSTKNVIRLNDSKDDLLKYYDMSDQRVGDNYGDGVNTHSDTGLFPFNNHDDRESKDLHYGFGIKFSIDFYLNDNGTLDGTTNGIPITFTFQGDDDVWVFLDDKLVLDMGGAHKNSIGEINFADRKVYIGAVSGITDTAYVSSALVPKSTEFKNSSIGIDDNSNYLKSGKHKITMYYLERGMLNSNLYVMFNLPLALTKFDLQNDTDFSGVNKGFEKATKYVAENDVFNYSIQNKNTTNVVGSEYKTPFNSLVQRTNGESGTSVTTTLSTAWTGTQKTYNFQGSSDGTYKPMDSTEEKGVTYQLTEPSFGGGGVTTFNTRTVGSTAGVVSMQYGEMATFSKQLNSGSTMLVTQLDNLSKPNGVDENGARKYDDSGTRKASDYYNTYYQEDEYAPTDKYRKYAGVYRGDDVTSTELKHVEPMYNVTGLKNYSTNHVINPQIEKGGLQYVFEDPEDAGNSYVYLRQVIVNEVKTVKLRITKDIFAGEKTEDSEVFRFKLHFSNVFGDDSASDRIVYTDIGYTKKSGSETTPGSLDEYGGFELKKGEYIEITGIPAQTKFWIEEIGSKNTSSPYVMSKDYSLNVGSESTPRSLVDDTYSIVTNKRKTGNMKLQKLVFDDTGKLITTAIDTEFIVKVTMTTSDKVDVRNYPLKFMLGTTDLTMGGDPKVTESEPTPDLTEHTRTITYTIRINPNQTKGGTNTITIENVPYDTKYSVVEGDIPAGYVAAGSKPAESCWTDTNYNTDTGTYTNIMYANALKKIGDSTKDFITVENMTNPIVMPETGGTGVILIFPLGILAIVLSGAAVMIYRRKMAYGYIFGKGRYMK